MISIGIQLVGLGSELNNLKEESSPFSTIMCNTNGHLAHKPGLTRFKMTDLIRSDQDLSWLYLRRGSPIG